LIAPVYPDNSFTLGSGQEGNLADIRPDDLTPAPKAKTL
jgi:hypothetical protein